MPYRIGHGVLGLQGLHELAGAVVLNGPGYRLAEIPGLHDLPDREDPRTAKVGRPGENDYPTSPLGKTVSYNGELEGDSVLDMLAAGQALRNVLADTRAPLEILVSPHEDDPNADEDSPTWSYTAKVLLANVPDTWEKLRWTRKFQVGLRMSDARFYVAALAVDVTGNPAAVTNQGGAPADPVMTIAGASGDVEITDGTRTLTFRNCPSGSLIVDFAAHTAMVGTDHVELVTSDSDWWDSHVYGIEKGASVSIAQTGGSSVRVQFTPGNF